MKKMEFIRDRKISSCELNFLDTVSALLSRRRAMIDGKRENLMKYCAAGIGVLTAVRAVLGIALNLSDRQWSIFGLALIIIFVIYILGTLGFWDSMLDNLENGPEYYGGTRGMPPQFILLFLFVSPAFLIFDASERTDRMRRMFSLGFPLTGAPVGAMIFNMLYNRDMERNMSELADTCIAYAYRRDMDGP
jgi:hypothetical protein